MDAGTGKLVLTNPEEVQIVVYDPEVDGVERCVTAMPKVDPREGQVWVCDTSPTNFDGTIDKVKADVDIECAVVCDGGYAILGRKSESDKKKIYWLDQEGTITDIYTCKYTATVGSYRHTNITESDVDGPMIKDRHGRLLVVEKGT